MNVSFNRSREISPEQVRLLLFKECDWRGRKLLFDSSAIQKVVAGKNDKSNNIRQTNEVPCIVEVSKGYSYVVRHFDLYFLIKINDLLNLQC